MKLHIDEPMLKRVLVLIAVGSLVVLTYNLLEPIHSVVPTDSTQTAPTHQRI
ncbi:MAG TPA: hypothetical protein V6C78_26410 [Crinalium sp.]